jgi:DtxR family Mn-dependent transcriptional regulator
MATSTVENYIKHIYLRSQRLPGGALVPMGEMALALGVTPGTATTMIKTLHEAGLVDYEPRLGTRLTEQGVTLALHVLRRHRLVELFLVQTLGMSWSEIHDEAEELEHAISERLLERIDRKLGYPTVDPHGDPIPSAGGEVSDRILVPLSEAKPGIALAIGRIADQGEEFLEFAEEKGLVPGKTVCLTARDKIAGVIDLEVEAGETVSVGMAAAAKIEVEESAR